ncbi:B9 domain-containing protein 2 [Nowakowskiella sp. JEL0078]|nr:B9 domain-containing protein 2 [Nowakowskiella sp. JEL0078]
MAESHFVGNIIGATGFPNSELCCKWIIIAGDDWRLLEGESHGQTHVDLPQDKTHTFWGHPIDVHYATKTIQGWPKIQFQDSFGLLEDGYGFVNVPASPGTHYIDCVTWRPAGSFIDWLWSFFLGVTPQLRNLDLIHSPTDRFRLSTITMGKIHLEISVITRNFENYGVQM